MPIYLFHTLLSHVHTSQNEREYSIWRKETRKWNLASGKTDQILLFSGKLIKCYFTLNQAEMPKEWWLSIAYYYYYYFLFQALGDSSKGFQEFTVGPYKTKQVWGCKLYEIKFC